MAAGFAECDSKQLGLYAVVDTVDWLEKCLAEGVKTVQLRMKNADDAALEESIASGYAGAEVRCAGVYQ